MSLFIGFVFLLLFSVCHPQAVHSVNYDTVFTLSSCSNCISFSAHTPYSTDCTTKTASDGTKGRVAIIRSSNVDNFITSNLGASSGRYLIDGTDSETEGVWKFKTGEVFWNGNASGSATQFSYNNWDSTEPNDWGTAGEDENSLTWWGSEFKWNDSPLTSNAGVICTYEHPVGGDRVADATGISAKFGIAATTKYARYEVFPEHVDQLTAFRRCEATLRTDPNTNKQVGGVLAVIYTKQDWDVLADLLSSKSDIKWHSSASNFGVWLGANTSANGKTWWQIEGTRTTETLLLRNSNGDPSQFVYPNFGTGSLGTNKAVTFGISNQKMNWVPKTFTLPYACRWSFNPESRVKITIPANSPPAISATDPAGTTASGELTAFLAVYHSEWRTTAQARADCWGKVRTNEVGDESRGLSGVLLEQPEWAAVDKLVQGTGWWNSGAQTQSDLRGIFLDVLTSTNVGWSTLNELKKRNSRGLIFNRGGRLPYTPDTLPWSTRMYKGGATTDCEPSQHCPTLAKYDNDQSGVATTLAYGSGGKVYTAMASRRRPYVCTYRFPVRARLEPWLVVEYHPFPMDYSSSVTVCSSRKVKVPPPGGGTPVEVTGVFAPFAEAGEKQVQKWLTDVVSGGSSDASLYYSGRVRLGAKHGQLCRGWARAAKVMVWESCTLRYEFVCQFVYPRTQTMSRTATNTSDPPRTRSNSSSQNTGTESHSTTRSGTLPESPSVTESGSVTESFSDSLSRSAAAAGGGGGAGTASSSSSLSHSHSESSSLPETLSESSSASFTQSQSSSETATLSQSSSQSSTASETLSGTATGSASGSATRTLPDTETASATASDSAPSRSDPSQTGTATLIATASSSVSRTVSLSDPTLTEHVIPQHVRPEAIKALQDITSVASLFSGGAIAVQRSRLEAADALARCGDPHQRVDEEPDLMSAPFKWKFGDDTVATRWQRGTAVGNVVAVIVSTVALYVVGAKVGFLRWKNPRRGLELFRLPGLGMLSVAVLCAPSVEAAAILLVHDPTNAAIARLIGVGALFWMVGIGMGVVIQVSRLVISGIVVVRNLPSTADKNNKCVDKINSTGCGRTFTRICKYWFTSDVGWVGAVGLSDYLDLVSSNKGKSAAAAQLAVQDKPRTKGENFLLQYGAIYEDFGYVPPSSKADGGGGGCCCCGSGGDAAEHRVDEHGNSVDSSYGYTVCAFYAPIDLGVSIVLGWCGGVAQGELSHVWCSIWLSVALLATSLHAFVLLWYRPCLVRGTQWFFAIGSALTLATVALATANYMTRKSFEKSGDFSEAIVDKIMLAQAGVGLFMVVISAGYSFLVILDFVDALLAKGDIDELEKAQRDQLSLYAKKTAGTSNSGGASPAGVGGSRFESKSGKNNSRHTQNFDQELAILVSAMLPRPDEEQHDDDLRALLGGGSSSSSSSTKKKKEEADLGGSALLMSPRAEAASTTNNSPNAEASPLSHRTPQQKQKQQQQQQQPGIATVSIYDDDAYAELLGGDGDADDDLLPKPKPPKKKKQKKPVAEMDDDELADAELDDLLGAL